MEYRIVDIDDTRKLIDYRASDAEEWRPTGLGVVDLVGMCFIGISLDAPRGAPLPEHAALMGTKIPGGYNRPDFSEWMNSQAGTP